MLNPREYDVEELRDVAGVEVRVDGGEAEVATFGRPLPAADLVTLARQYRELAARGREPDGNSGGQRRPSSERGSDGRTPDGEALPLDGVPDDAGSVMLTLEWLDFLVYRAGVHGALGALDYYRDVGWLTGRAERQLRSYLRGLDAPGSGTGGLGALDARDHRQSLVFVSRLAAGDGLPRPEADRAGREVDESDRAPAGARDVP